MNKERQKQPIWADRKERIRKRALRAVLRVYPDATLGHIVDYREAYEKGYVDALRDARLAKREGNMGLFLRPPR